MKTNHFCIRSQQRGLPPGVQELLDRFGDIQYDGAGKRIVYMSSRSKRSMEKEFGTPLVGRLGNWSNAYRIENSAGDIQITTGLRRDRIRRH